MAKPQIVCVVGTRPDTIKTAPVLKELEKYSKYVDTILVSTGQHKEIRDQSFGVFGLKSQYDLGIMRHGQTLAQITTRSLEGLDEIFCKIKPDFVMAQGDTTTTFIASLAAFYHKVPFGHIEAGLRTSSIDQPYPEEFNRRGTAIIAKHHYSPTPWAANNLFEERVNKQDVFITGNTGIDAVRMVADATQQTWFPNEAARILTLTTHRRENWGQPQKNIVKALYNIVERFSDTILVVSAHPNPIVRESFSEQFISHPRIKMIEPPAYPEFVKLMQRSHLIFTDSGGIQEEAPTFGVPVLVLREDTERPEGVTAGNAILVGADADRIEHEGGNLLSNSDFYKNMSQAVSPYGDGRAAARIRYLALRYLGIESPEENMWTYFKQ